MAIALSEKGQSQTYYVEVVRRAPTIKILLFALMCSLLSSCSYWTNSCSRLQKEIRNAEAPGVAIYFREFEIERNRYLRQESLPSSLSDAAVSLLKNYLEVHELLLSNPECLVESELESTLKEGLPRLREKIKAARTSNDIAFIVMSGPLSEAYQSMELWVKER
jgi:hypothetical protein